MSLSATIKLTVWVLWLAVAVSLLTSTPTTDAAAQSIDLAERAKTILTDRCLKCHGQNGVAKKNIFVLDRERLIASKTLTPGDAGSLLLRVVDSDEMPFGGPPLPPVEKDALRAWIAVGAPAWQLDPKPFAPRFIDEREILARLRDDLLRASERDRPYLRYFSIAHLSNGGATEAELAVNRAALAKLVNSLSWHSNGISASALPRAAGLTGKRSRSGEAVGC